MNTLIERNFQQKEVRYRIEREGEMSVICEGVVHYGVLRDEKGRISIEVEGGPMIYVGKRVCMDGKEYRIEEIVKYKKSLTNRLEVRVLCKDVVG